MKIHFMPADVTVETESGETLLDVLQRSGLAVEAPCGGQGKCGKCRVSIDGVQHLACQTKTDRDMEVVLSDIEKTSILSEGIKSKLQADDDLDGDVIAVDLGTTTVVCYLLDHEGKELACKSMLNPQSIYGADVITRIQEAESGKLEEMSACIREGITQLIREACAEVHHTTQQVRRIVLVGNPCMQQIFLGMPVGNLARVPFAPVLTAMEKKEAAGILPVCPNAYFLIVPDISGYVGADTLGCVLSTELYNKDRLTLMVDIGTNGEMVMGNASHMIACSTAAGPALEGANIHSGMRGSRGAIDHVEVKEGRLDVHVIGEGAAEGICGSGLIDAAACMLREGIINARGRITTAQQKEIYADRLKEVDGERVFYLTDKVYLTQTDVRQVQLAKGAIAAGILLMAGQLGITLEEIDQVLLAGAFGSFIRPESACEIGLIPKELLGKIRAVGNAAGSGAKLMAVSEAQQKQAAELKKQIEFLELASLPEFQNCFGKQTAFPKV